MSIGKSRLTNLIVAMILAAGLAAGCLPLSSTAEPKPTRKLPRFSSCESLVEAFERSDEGIYFERDLAMPLAKSAPPTMAMPQAELKAGLSDSGPDHSTTNVQVEGVDEADIVKNDGKYIYLVAKNKVIICLAYPPSESKILSKSSLEPNSTVSELYIGPDRLAAIGTKYSEENHSGLTFLKIWNTDDKSNPRVLREVEVEGSYSTSRKIGDFIYLVLNSYPDYAIYEKEDIDCGDIVPKYRDTVGDNPAGDFRRLSKCKEIGRLDKDSFSMFLSIVAVSLEDSDKATAKQVIAGSGENVYASVSNLYVVSTEYDPEVPFPLNIPEIADEKTTIHKFALDKEAINYSGSASVPGTVLNQFSMDEHEKYFRIATTRGHVFQEDSNATNNIYVLDDKLQIVGKIENIAPGERIYSARFMGDRGYLVTFKKVDPFFTLDLKDPENPKVMGELKIPGYSDYLHPYDENHIIGIGKNTEEAEEGDFAWYQGLKMALFDVSDFANPKEVYKVEIGDRGTDSYVLQDHKAFLFDKERNLLVIPVLLAERTPEESEEKRLGSEYGDYTYQGAYVYDLSAEHGFELKGRITHTDDFSKTRSYYYFGDETSIKRSLYIGDFLYTVSEAKLMVHDLASLEEVNEVGLD